MTPWETLGPVLLASIRLLPDGKSWSPGGFSPSPISSVPCPPSLGSWRLVLAGVVQAEPPSDSIMDFGKPFCLDPRTKQCVVLNDGDSYLNSSEEASLKQSMHKS